MNKFRRFLGKISAEICQKKSIILVVNPKKLPKAGGSAPDHLTSGGWGLIAPRLSFSLND